MNLHHLLEIIIPNLASIMEIIGVIMIIYGVVRSLYLFFKAKGNLMVSNPKLDLARALEYSLEFKLAAEILKSVIVQTIQEFAILAGIVLLRVILTFVIHWEIKSSEKSQPIQRMPHQHEKEE